VLVATFLSCFVFGGFTGLLLANAAIDLAYHDTYFVIGHFHYVLSIAAAIGLSLFVKCTVCFNKQCVKCNASYCSVVAWYSRCKCYVFNIAFDRHRRSS